MGQVDYRSSTVVKHYITMTQRLPGLGVRLGLHITCTNFCLMSLQLDDEDDTDSEMGSEDVDAS